MTTQKAWLASTGAFLYDDTALYDDPDGDMVGETLEGFATTGQILVQEAPVRPWHVMRLIDGTTITQIEIDFGATPVAEAIFMVADGSVTASSIITGGIAYQAPTGKDLDELEMDSIYIIFGASAGQVNIFAKGLEGYLHDKFLVNYVVGVN